MAVDHLDLKQELISGFPEGTADFIDFADPDGPGPLLEAAGRLFAARGTDQVEELRRELSPLTCSLAGIAVWERSTGLHNSKMALTGQPEERRDQVLARLREHGAPTFELVRKVLVAYLRYADLNRIDILESDRMKVRRGNEKRQPGPYALSAVPVNIPFEVRDDPRVSQAGAFVELRLVLQPPATLADLTASLIAPAASKTITWPIGTIGHGLPPAGSPNLRIYFKGFAEHRPILGVWILRLALHDALFGQASNLTLLVEGRGRYRDWLDQNQDGLGAAMYEWGPVARNPFLGLGYDLDGGQLATRRLTYARAYGNLIREPLDAVAGDPPEKFAAIPDDPWCIPDACIPGES